MNRKAILALVAIIPAQMEITAFLIAILALAVEKEKRTNPSSEPKRICRLHIKEGNLAKASKDSTS